MILEGTFTGLEGSGLLTVIDYFGQDDGMAIYLASCRQTRVCGLGYGGSRSRADTGMKTSEGLESELVPSYPCCALLGKADCKRRARRCRLLSGSSYRVT